MKAFVYRGKGQKALEERPKPQLQAPGDAIIEVLSSSIGGNDLHILEGEVTPCAPGRILGHEGVGIVDAIGAGVTAFHIGDQVLISCVSSCGRCEHCGRGMPSHCTSGGWILGQEIDGTEAEFVRVPHADTSLCPLPAGTDDEAMALLGEFLPAGFACGVLDGKVAPGSTVAIVGSGPIGLAALLTAHFHSPAQIIVIDRDERGLEMALTFGATTAINSADGQAAARVKALTAGRGVDTAIETLGLPAGLLLCRELVATDGVVADITVHGQPAGMQLAAPWSRSVSITTRRVDANALQKAPPTRRPGPARPIAHRFRLEKILDAYETFGRAAASRAPEAFVGA